MKDIEAIKKTEQIKNGEILRFFYQKGNVNNKVIHILANFEDESQIAFKWWSYVKKRWIYDIVSHWTFIFAFLDGNLTTVKNKINWEETDPKLEGENT